MSPTAASVSICHRRSCLPPPLPLLLSAGTIANVAATATATATATPVPSAVIVHRCLFFTTAYMFQRLRLPHVSMFLLVVIVVIFIVHIYLLVVVIVLLLICPADICPHPPTNNFCPLLLIGPTDVLHHCHEHDIHHLLMRITLLALYLQL